MRYDQAIPLLESDNVYLGFSTGLKDALINPKTIESLDKIQLTLNIDGLPLFRSTY